MLGSRNLPKIFSLIVISVTAMFGLDKLKLFLLAFLIFWHVRVVVTVLCGLLIVVDRNVQDINLAMNLVVYVFGVWTLSLLFHLAAKFVTVAVWPLLLLVVSILSWVLLFSLFCQFVLEPLYLGFQKLISLVHFVQDL